MDFPLPYLEVRAIGAKLIITHVHPPYRKIFLDVVASIIDMSTNKETHHPSIYQVLPGTWGILTFENCLELPAKLGKLFAHIAARHETFCRTLHEYGGIMTQNLGAYNLAALNLG